MLCATAITEKGPVLVAGIDLTNLQRLAGGTPLRISMTEILKHATDEDRAEIAAFDATQLDIMVAFAPTMEHLINDLAAAVGTDDEHRAAIHQELSYARARGQETHQDQVVEVTPGAARRVDGSAR